MIEIEHLTKRYGEHLAVSDLSFTVDSGQIYGFLGPNGAGKSTTMNIMTGCLSATEGHVRIEGCDIFDQPDKAKRLIGYLPEQPPLYMNETPEEYLRFVGEAKGLRRAELERQMDEVISQTGIGQTGMEHIAIERHFPHIGGKVTDSNIRHAFPDFCLFIRGQPGTDGRTSNALLSSNQL